MDGLWIAIVSAAGVIGASLIQWRSNVTTNRNSNNRESNELEYRNKQQAKETSERETIRREERAEREVLREAELAEKERLLTFERNAQWLAKRQDLHEQALDVLNPLVEKAKVPVNDLTVLVALKAKREGSSTSAAGLKNFEDLFNAQHSNLQKKETSILLYGSRESSATYVQVLQAMQSFTVTLTELRLGPWFWMLDANKKDHFYTQENLEQLKSAHRELDTAHQKYIASARKDLQTN